MIVEKYILYGASFNPPHIGHFSAIQQMLQEYDKVFVFPYPKKYSNGVTETLPPINQRMKMLEVFFAEFFPQVYDRLLLVDLAKVLKEEHGDKVFHTYDYLECVKNRLPDNAHLSVCLGFDAQNLLRKETFHNREEIEKKYGVFELEEENKIKSEDLRQFFSSHKNLASAKDELYIRYAVGHSLAQHIFEHNLYGIKKKVLKPKENKEDKVEEEKPIKIMKKKM
jgi:nicotinic acid mononucleotide adenylyltransferase